MPAAARSATKDCYTSDRVYNGVKRVSGSKAASALTRAKRALERAKKASVAKK